LLSTKQVVEVSEEREFELPIIRRAVFLLTHIFYSINFNALNRHENSLNLDEGQEDQADRRTKRPPATLIMTVSIMVIYY
jgi:hypothetical protein